MSKNKSMLFLPLFLGAVIWILVACATTTATENIPSGQSEAVESSVVWLIENNQNDDGGYGVDFETGQPASSVASTVDAILAIASSGYDPAEPYSDRKETPVDYLNDNVGALTAYGEGSGGNAGKVILALTNANQDPRGFAERDWVLMLTDQIAPSGQYNTSDAFNQSLAILALSAVNEPLPESSVQWLKDQQADDGSWDDGFGTLQNPDTISMSIMALFASGASADDPAKQKGVQFLADSQLPTGGWEYGPGFGENANSTALVVQALATIGENFYAEDSPWSQKGQTPLTALMSYQNSNGAFQADFGQGPVDNFFATVQAIPALASKP